jgi:protein gp37
MSLNTQIQWCDSTVNPVMGCDGCPLFPNISIVRADLARFTSSHGTEFAKANELLSRLTAGMSLTDMQHQRTTLAAALTAEFGWQASVRRLFERRISSHIHCYAATLHLRWGGNRLKPDKKVNSGLSPFFEQVTKFPGRMAQAAAWESLYGIARPDKPWLSGLPRLIFVSDMGDALSAAVSFKFLCDEIVGVVASHLGRRHLWLWLTKRPAKMAQFARWLQGQGLKWPENLVAMASVLDARMAKAAIGLLRRVPTKIRALSVEPLLGPVTLDLKGIDWVIVGGESGAYARPFHLEWARDLLSQCRAAGVAFFMKQLGARPHQDGQVLKLCDGHGGDWTEWPEDLRIRQLPPGFPNP